MESRTKDASVGEYDPRSGLTHVTRQRGRLLFNMGASVRKQRPQPEPLRASIEPLGGSTGAATINNTLPAPPTSATTRLTTGTFTGLSLYPEEALYLLQRGALSVFLLSEGRGDDEKRREPLDAPALNALVLQHQRASLACLEVYAFLKDEKLHPRRCSQDPQDGEHGLRRAPQHMASGGCSPTVAFDVFKSLTAPPVPREGAAAAAEPLERPTPSTSKPVKRLQLVFRVLVSRFEDPPPPAKMLREALAASRAERPSVPVKLAVVSRDRSVLLLELSALDEP